jgi:hypothetical protein
MKALLWLGRHFLLDVEGVLPPVPPAIGDTLVRQDNHTLDVEKPRMDLSVRRPRDADIPVRSMHQVSHRGSCSVKCWPAGGTA